MPDEGLQQSPPMTPDDTPEPGTLASLPLAGIRVLEIGQNIAGPYASAILAALGADVVKIERPEGGDDARGWGPPFWKGMATTFHAMNRDKRSVALDLKDPAAIAWLKDYLRDCDVLVQNLRPGVMRELGLDAPTLLAVNPRLVYCSLWAFGHTGPMHLKPGYEPMIQAFAGIFSVNGSEDGPPTRVGMQILDLGTGVWSALGCLAALFQRQSTGRGCVVDTSLLETAMGWLGVMMAGFSATRQPPPRHRSGNPRVVVFQAFATRDGEVVVAAANDRLFAKLVRELGRPDWADDPRLATNALRVANKPLVIPAMEAIFAQRPSAEWVERLEAIGVPCAPINDLSQIAAAPQTAALGILQTVPGVDLDIVGLPVSFDGHRPPVRRRAPELGEHTEELTGRTAQQPLSRRTDIITPYKDLVVSRDGHVAVVEICRPPNNFFDMALIGGIADCFEAFDAEHDVRAIVLAAQGKAFCAGADFSGGRRQPVAEGEVNPLYYEAIRLFACRKPVVCAVQGAAVGGGLGLALVGDFRVAGPDARFSANFNRMGFHPGFGLSVTLPRLIGVQKASQLFYTGRRVPGEEAFAMGLADRFVPQAEVRDAAIALAREIATSAPIAVQATRATLRAGLVEQIRAAVIRESREQGSQYKTDDFKEGIQAMAERREPVFTGR